MPDRFHNVHAVLFDVDGTLLNTFEFIYGAFEHALATHCNLTPGRDVISRVMGGPLEECYTKLAPGHDARMLTEAHREFQSGNIKLARLFPSTILVLDHLREAGLKLAAITTRSLRTSVRSLESNRIAHYFEVILSAEDVENPKPHPEPVLTALTRMDVAPQHAVMIGDTYADVLAGKNAGTRTIGALYGFGGERLLETEPDAVIHDLGELLPLLGL